MRPFARASAVAVAALALVAAPACGKKSKKVVKTHQHAAGSGALAAPTADDLATAPRVPVGAFTVPVPSGWKDVSAERARPEQVGLQTTVRQPPVLLILSPAPEPMPFDPTNPTACADAGRKMPGVVGTPSVVEIPPGKACVVETDDHGRMTMFVIVKDGKGVMAQCQFEQARDHGACDAIIHAIAPR
jgi:hypothetical protein